MLARSHPKVVTMLDDARNDLLAFACFPQRHWRQIWCTNPLERVNKEIKRCTDVVGAFPNLAALLRLAGAVLIEQHDEWEDSDRRYFFEPSMLELKTMNTHIEPAEEVNILPELAAAETKTTDPHGVEKLHHSAGRYRRQPSPRPLSAECRIGRRGAAPRQKTWRANEDGSRAGYRLEQHGRDRGEPSLWIMRPRWCSTRSRSCSGVVAQNSVR